jgi:hypothetical protein
MLICAAKIERRGGFTNPVGVWNPDGVKVQNPVGVKKSA